MNKKLEMPLEREYFFDNQDEESNDFEASLEGCYDTLGEAMTDGYNQAHKEWKAYHEQEMEESKGSYDAAIDMFDTAVLEIVRLKAELKRLKDGLPDVEDIVITLNQYSSFYGMSSGNVRQIAKAISQRIKGEK